MSYKEAVRLAATRFKNIKYVPASERHLQTGRLDLVGIRRWVKALGLERKSFDVIHVTGTKGKGGTCAWTQALIHSYFKARAMPAKVGRYTSPHLTTYRERVVVGTEPVSERVFADRFFHVWETLLADVGGREEDMPGYLQLMALLSADIFQHQGVDVVVYEVHAGGRVDATNMWDDTLVCGFNTIGLDHVPMLGNDVAEIARNKAGIMKPSCVAFSVPQVPEAREQLEAEAAKLGCPLTFVDPGQVRILDQPARPDLQLPAQRGNLALAIELANAYLSARFGGRLSDADVAEAMRTYRLPGRLQVVEEPASRTRWHLDIAHNDISIPVALDWFIAEVRRQHDSRGSSSSRSSSSGIKHHYADDGVRPPEPDLGPESRPARILIFGHASKHRDTANLINALIGHCRSRGFAFDRVILAAHRHFITGSALFGREVAEATAHLWKGFAPPVAFADSIEEAMQSVRDAAGPLGSHALVVGSSHLVSSALLSMQAQQEPS